MPKRLLLALFLSVFFLPVFFQVQLASADDAPVTSPISFFNLTGKVTYKQLGSFFSSFLQVTPAEDVEVHVEGFFDDDLEFTTTTDVDGMYHLNVPAGKYKVEVEDEDDTFFVPIFRVVDVKANKEKTANFQGLVFP